MLTWEKFRSVPRRYLKKGEPLRVSYGRKGSWGWMEIRYYPKRKRSKPGRITGNCSFCGFMSCLLMNDCNSASQSLDVMLLIIFSDVRRSLGLNFTGTRIFFCCSRKSSSIFEKRSILIRPSLMSFSPGNISRLECLLSTSSYKLLVLL